MKRSAGELWKRLTQWERPFWRRGVSVGGVDEVGRGPLAGPVVAAYVQLKPFYPLFGVDDSKSLSAAVRESLCERILETAEAVAVAFIGPREIERINILQASKDAMREAVGSVRVPPKILLTDAVALGGPWQEWALLHGDSRSASIAAASIVAKVMRDRYMAELDRQFPGYGFTQNKGYATREHYRALHHFGVSEAHRRTFIH